MKNAFIDIPIQGVQLSNNYMDLLPNQTTSLVIKTTEDLTLDQIKISSLNDLMERQGVDGI
mgnify:CR=1 FL=1